MAQKDDKTTRATNILTDSVQEKRKFITKNKAETLKVYVYTFKFCAVVFVQQRAKKSERAREQNCKFVYERGTLEFNRWGYH